MLRSPALFPSSVRGRDTRRARAVATVDLNLFLFRPVESMGDAGGEAAGHRQLARHQRLLEQYKEKLRRNDTRSCCLHAVAGAPRPACTSGAILTMDVSVVRSNHSKLVIKHDKAIITGSSARSSANSTPRNPCGDPQRATSPRARASGAATPRTRSAAGDSAHSTSSAASAAAARIIANMCETAYADTGASLDGTKRREDASREDSAEHGAALRAQITAQKRQLDELRLKVACLEKAASAYEEQLAAKEVQHTQLIKEHHVLLEQHHALRDTLAGMAARSQAPASDALHVSVRSKIDESIQSLAQEDASSASSACPSRAEPTSARSVGQTARGRQVGPNLARLLKTRENSNQEKIQKAKAAGMAPLDLITVNYVTAANVPKSFIEQNSPYSGTYDAPIENFIEPPVFRSASPGRKTMATAGSDASSSSLPGLEVNVSWPESDPSSVRGTGDKGCLIENGQAEDGDNEVLHRNRNALSSSKRKIENPSSPEAVSVQNLPAYPVAGTDKDTRVHTRTHFPAVTHTQTPTVKQRPQHNAEKF